MDKISLSKRELQVLVLIASGFNNFEISRKLSISTHTVKAHIASILIKLKTATRTSAAVTAIKLGLIKIS